MDYSGHENIASVCLFDLKLSEGELMVYESCIKYVLKECDESQIYEITGCDTKEELKSYQDDIRSLIMKYADKKYLPEEYLEDK